MTRKAAFILAFLMLGAAAHHAAAQEVLRPARIQAKASRKQPALGLPARLDGQIDSKDSRYALFQTSSIL